MCLLCSVFTETMTIIARMDSNPSLMSLLLCCTSCDQNVCWTSGMDSLFDNATEALLFLKRRQDVLRKLGVFIVCVINALGICWSYDDCIASEKGSRIAVASRTRCAISCGTFVCLLCICVVYIVSLMITILFFFVFPQKTGPDFMSPELKQYRDDMQVR